MCDELKTIGFQYEGAFAEYVEIPRQAIAMGNVITLPDAVDYDSATLIEPAACALNGQSYMRVANGDYVLIYGSGMIGCMHAELAFLKGAAKVLVVEPAESRGRAAEAHVPGIIWINPAACSVEEEVARHTEGRGANVVIVATSFPDVQLEAQKVAAKMARISLFGGLAGNSLGYIDSNLVHYKELQVCGVHATTPGFMREILGLMQEGRFDTGKYVDKRVSIENVMDGFAAIRDENVVKVVIQF
jgi:Threonine dehydrogenase and related Zn-dependent dehydrogenases